MNASRSIMNGFERGWQIGREIGNVLQNYISCLFFGCKINKVRVIKLESSSRSLSFRRTQISEHNCCSDCV
jgi:hypothetical protein